MTVLLGIGSGAFDSENIWQNQSEWQDLWNIDRPEKYVSMSPDEREDLALLSHELDIYRGVGGSSHLEGLSWTLDREKAIWFGATLRWRLRCEGDGEEV